MFHRKLIVLLLLLCFLAYGDYFALNLGLGFTDFPARLRRIGGGEDKELNLSALSLGGGFGYYDYDKFIANLNIQMLALDDEQPGGIDHHYFDDGTQATFASLTFVQLSLAVESFLIRKEWFGLSATGSCQFDFCQYYAYKWDEGEEDVGIDYHEQRTWLGGGIKIYPVILSDEDMELGIFASGNYLYDFSEKTASLPISVGISSSQVSFSLWLNILDGWSSWGIFCTYNLADAIEKLSN